MTERYQSILKGSIGNPCPDGSIWHDSRSDLRSIGIGSYKDTDLDRGLVRTIRRQSRIGSNRLPDPIGRTMALDRTNFQIRSQGSVRSPPVWRWADPLPTFPPLVGKIQKIANKELDFSSFPDGLSFFCSFVAIQTRLLLAWRLEWQRLFLSFFPHFEAVVWSYSTWLEASLTKRMVFLVSICCVVR